MRSSPSRHMPAVDAPVPPATEVESHDHGAEDDALSQAMLRVLERVAGANVGNGVRGSIFERLRANRAEIFRGVSGIAPNVAEYWLEATEWIMDNLDCSEEIVSGVSVLSPLGHSVRVDKLYRDVPLETQGKIFPGDLMELPFGEFDLILGMDWLVKHKATLDCAAKRMVLRTTKDEEVMVIGERRDYLSNVVSALKAEKWIQKGCEAYLAFVS